MISWHHFKKGVIIHELVSSFVKQEAAYPCRFTKIAPDRPP